MSEAIDPAKPQPEPFPPGTVSGLRRVKGREPQALQLSNVPAAVAAVPAAAVGTLPACLLSVLHIIFLKFLRGKDKHFRVKN
jgi:hypothetical protein